MSPITDYRYRIEEQITILRKGIEICIGTLHMSASQDKSGLPQIKLNRNMALMSYFCLNCKDCTSSRLRRSSSLEFLTGQKSLKMYKKLKSFIWKTNIHLICKKHPYIPVIDFNMDDYLLWTKRNQTISCFKHFQDKRSCTAKLESVLTRSKQD